VAVPFGGGPRICPGRYLALAEIKMVTAILLGSFAIEAITTPGGADAQERLALTMSPVDLQMWLRPSGDKASVS
jgi:cytochrome P450